MKARSFLLGLLLLAPLAPWAAANTPSGLAPAEYNSDPFIALGVTMMSDAHVSESTLLSYTVLEVTGLTRMRPEPFLGAFREHFKKRGLTPTELPPSLRELGMQAISGGKDDLFGVALISNKPIRDDIYLVKLYSPRPPGSRPIRKRLKDRHPEIALLTKDPLLEREYRSEGGDTLLIGYETSATATQGVENAISLLAAASWQRSGPLLHGDPKDPDDMVMATLTKGGHRVSIIGSKPDAGEEQAMIMLNFTFAEK